MDIISISILITLHLLFVGYAIHVMLDNARQTRIIKEEVERLDHRMQRLNILQREVYLKLYRKQIDQAKIDIRDKEGIPFINNSVQSYK